jgi:thiamine kinase-like enzyme
VSLCHGDPVLGNTLRLRDGRLALVDWELAGVLPVGGDLAKVLLSAPDRRPLYDQLDRYAHRGSA